MLLARPRVSPAQHARHRVALEPRDDRMIVDGNLLVRLCRGSGTLSAREIIRRHEDRHVLRVAREEHALLCRREAAADDEDLLPRKELAVAGRAVGDAAPAERLLAIEADGARVRARREQHRRRRERAAVRLDAPGVPLPREREHLAREELRTEARRLLLHPLRQCRAGHRLRARVVDDLLRDGDLPAELRAFYDKNAAASTRKVDASRETRRSAADHDAVVEVFCCRFHIRALRRDRGSASASCCPVSTSRGRPHRRARRRTSAPAACGKARPRCARRCRR